MSTCDSTVLSGGYLSTTLDRKEHNNDCGLSEFNVRLLSISSHHKGHQTSSEQKMWQTGMFL